MQNSEKDSSLAMFPIHAHGHPLSSPFREELDIRHHRSRTCCESVLYFQQGLQHAEFALPSDFDKLL